MTEKPVCVTFKQIIQNVQDLRKKGRDKEREWQHNSLNLYFTVAVQMETGDLAGCMNEAKQDLGKKY